MLETNHKDITLEEFEKKFSTEDDCLNYLFDSIHTRECGCGGRYKQLENRPQFQCSKCRYMISPQVGTIFEKSRTPLKSWFYGIYLFTSKKGLLGASELEKEINVTYKTAWRMIQLFKDICKKIEKA